MKLDLSLLTKDCPNELEEDLKVIINLSTELLDRTTIWADQHTKEIKVDLQEANDLLMQIIGLFVTLISNNYIEDMTDRQTLGFALKFEEDMGLILKTINESNEKPEKLMGFSTLLNQAGELKKVFNFIIFQPIVLSNRKQIKDLNEYFVNIFKTVRVNASILGYSGRPLSIAPSRRILNSPLNLISQPAQPEQPGTNEEAYGMAQRIQELNENPLIEGDLDEEEDEPLEED